MKRGGGIGVFFLVIILFASLILAASWNLAPSTASAGDTISLISFNVSSSSHGNSTNFTNFTSVLINITGTAYSGLANITNVTISNGTTGFTFYNDSFTTAPVNITLNTNISNLTEANSTGNNWTVNFTLSASATYSITLGANVTGIANETVNTTVLQYSTLPYNSSLATINETTAPVASASCSPIDFYVGDSFPCSCAGTDSGANASGVATTSGSSNSPDGTSTPTVVGVFTYTCSVTDNAGNSGADTIQYTVSNVGGGGSGTPQPPKNSHSWTKITPGVVTIMKDFDSEIGVKEIQITVNNQAQNVKITVTKYDGKPAEVSVEKSGKVYQYVEIDAENLGAKLNRATVRFRVEKSWMSNNKLDSEEISVYKFNEGSSKWNELSTTPSGEDSSYHYYDVELDSFSHFSIGEKSLVAGEGVTAEGEEPSEGTNLTWLWILVGIVLVFLIWKGTKKKKRK
jgi:PGF-pre-PGF domain-containing protein